MRPIRPPTAAHAGADQARVSIPDSAQDRRQWLKQQSKSRRRRRRSSGGGAAAPQDGRGRRSSTLSEEGSFSRDSSVGSDASDASSVLSNLSIVSTPEISQRQRYVSQQQQTKQQTKHSFDSPGRDLLRRASKGRSNASAAAPHGKLPRKSLSAAVSSSLSLRWCGVCEAEFTRLRRPHRCRRCLEAVCAPCSPARLPVPGTGSHELKRTCKLCAGDAAEPTTDAVVSQEKDTTAVDARAGKWRSGSVGSITRAPIEMLSGVAAAVTAGLYPTATGAADGGGAAGKGKVGSSDGGEASLTSRLASGGLAAWGAVGAGISMSSEKLRGAVDGTTADVGGTTSASADKPASESATGGERNGASVTARLAAGGMAALGAVGAGIGLSSEKSPGEVDGSVPTGVSGAPPEPADRPASSAGGDAGSAERDGASITARLAAGGLAALGKMGTGLSGDKPWKEVGVSVLSAGGLSADVGAKGGGSAKSSSAEFETEAAPAGSLKGHSSSTSVDPAHQKVEMGVGRNTWRAAFAFFVVMFSWCMFPAHRNPW